MLTDLDTQQAQALAALEEALRELEVKARQAATLAEALRDATPRPGLPLTPAQRAEQTRTDVECAEALGFTEDVLAQLRRGEHYVG